MTRAPLRFASLCLLSLLAGSVAAEGTLTGVVHNATTGAPAAGVDVLLLQLQGGMETVANTKTDAQGRYRFEYPVIGRQPMLVRVIYRGVNFHQSVPPGRDTADVEVFEPTADAKAVQVASRLIALQPNGSTLLVGEEYTVRNNAQPPAAYYKADGNFEFQVPEGAELAQVSAWGPSGMPVVQGTMDRGSHRYAIAFAFRPGESGVRVSYQMPYASNQAVVRVTSPYAAQRVMILAPPSVQVVSAGFQPAGSEQGWNVYTRDGVPAGALFDISVSGAAPLPSASEQQGEPEQQGRDAGRTGAVVQALPARLDSLKWVLLVGFAALFALGAVFLWRRPAAVTSGSKARPAAGPTSRVTADVNRDVAQGLEQLKDKLFRLELRRQAGTLSEEDYARERSRVEEVLRDLVEG